jgi:hypothetical protein
MLYQAIEVAVGLREIIEVLIPPEVFQTMVRSSVQCLRNDLVGFGRGDFLLLRMFAISCRARSSRSAAPGSVKSRSVTRIRIRLTNGFIDFDTRMFGTRRLSGSSATPF